ncbi:MAG: ATP-binding protein [Xanthobacteraceae bacterium]|nr:ATP-binding protein [Xanthobacteraceae bacterium]
MRIEYRGGALRALVGDDGRAFDPFSQPAPATRAGIAKRKVGGLGIHLLRSLMQLVEYHRIDGRNVLTFQMPVSP